MSATNLTKNLKLSQFVASDKPSWLGDVNGDNKKIDDGYGVLAGEISKANDTASSAKSQSDANTQTLTNVNTELEDYGNRITALEAGGGTEQLEQRVNTLGTDVETLQTRADTFEGDISQNGTDITTLKSKVATIEPKVKTNSDNITSLQTSNTSILNEIQGLHEVNTQQGQLIANAQTTAQNAKNTADSTEAQLNITKATVNTLNESVNALNTNATKIEIASLNANSTYIKTVSPIQMFVTKSNIYFNMFVLELQNTIPYDSYTALGTFSLPSTVNSILSGSGSSSASEGIFLTGMTHKNISFYIEVTGKTATLYGKPATAYNNSQEVIGVFLNNLVFN